MDGIPVSFVQDFPSIIAAPLTHIVYHDLKTARVVSLLKKNDKTEVGNYRPVSILSIIFKIVERIIYDQLEQYLVTQITIYISVLF